jgi:hypothetical protein
MGRNKYGDYEAIKGKLSRDDSREAYVTGPTPSGRTAPLASFWSLEEAKRWARTQAEKQVCTNCEQWQSGPSQDCFNECRKRGLVS